MILVLKRLWIEQSGNFKWISNSLRWFFVSVFIWKFPNDFILKKDIYCYFNTISNFNIIHKMKEEEKQVRVNVENETFLSGLMKKFAQ